MITIPELVEQILIESPFLEEGLAKGIINLSALAREIKPEIERRLLKEVKEGAIIMALKRLSEKTKRKDMQVYNIIKNIRDITVRSHLMEFTFLRSESLLEKQGKLIDEISNSNRKDIFFTFTQGIFEVTMIVSSIIEKDVERIFKGEKLLSKFTNLSSITIRLPDEAIFSLGVFYSILKILSWANINIIEVVSTYTEFTIVIDESQVDRAFSILKKLSYGFKV